MAREISLRSAGPAILSVHFKGVITKMLKIMKATIAGLAFGLVFGTVGLAQPAPTTQNSTPGIQQRQGFRRMAGRRALRRRGMMGAFRALRQLNLTDAQKEQARSIIQSNFASTKATREELAKLWMQRREGTLTAEQIARAKELRAQLQASRKGVRTQLTGILTPDQKAKLEEMIKNRRANHERFGSRRQMPNKPM
jgi:Spy/CpxP family protein refolding chaperone